MLSRESKGRNRANRLLLIVLLLMSIGFFSQAVFNYTKLSDLILFLAPCILLVAVLYGFWRIPQEYKVKVVSSSSPIAKKSVLVQQYIESKGGYFLENKQKLYRITYATVHWTRLSRIYFQLNISVNQDGFLVNVRQLSGRNGFVDFGSSNRETKKLIAYLTKHLRS